MRRPAAYTVVLGGSAGIGFAFAECCASRSHRLIIVARSKSTLRKARKRLLASGAREVLTISGDLLDPRFRSRLLSSLRDKRLSTLFIGGPNPPAGRVATVDWRSARRACEICILYPLHIASSVLRPPSTGIRIIFLSSSAAKEDLHSHPFFLSALFRRTAETMLEKLVSNRSTKATFVVWRPTVVYSALAKRYARSLPRSTEDDTLMDRLKRTFRLSFVPTPREYLSRMMRECDE